MTTDLTRQTAQHKDSIKFHFNFDPEATEIRGDNKGCIVCHFQFYKQLIQQQGLLFYNNAIFSSLAILYLKEENKKDGKVTLSL